MLTRGLWWPERPCRVHVDDGRAEEERRRSRTGCSRGARGPLDVRISRGNPCGGNQGLGHPEIGRHRGNWGGSTAHRRRFLREIPMMQRLGAQMLGSGSLQVAR
jgi:hypothetical protein